MNSRLATNTGWSNWTGSATSPKAKVASPANETELLQELQQAKAPLRTAGAGHSFSPLIADAGTIVRLENLKAPFEVSADKGSVQLAAGMKLKTISQELDGVGLAFKNLGDINVQSLAGAVSTATHGTGQSLPCLSAEILSLRLATAKDGFIDIDGESAGGLLDASRVSLGALGIITAMTVSVRPKFNLQRRTWVEPLQTALPMANQRWAKHRNYEFLYIPFSGLVLNIAHDETDLPATERPASTDESDLRSLRLVRSVLRRVPALRRSLLQTAFGNAKGEECIGNSWELLASVRETRFNEMEYHLPVDRGLAAFEEVVQLIERDRTDVFFPIEVRQTAPDKSWLSPFNDGPRISVAIHAHQPDDYKWFFDLAEPVFRRAGGRPHWGKMHSLNRPELEVLYPQFADFCALRQRLDPEGLFLNGHLRQLFVGNQF